MSSSIDFRFYDGPRHARTTILAIVRRLSLMQTVSKEWSGLGISKRSAGSLSLLSGPFDRLTVNDAEELISRQDSGTLESWCITGTSSLSISEKIAGEADTETGGDGYFAIDVRAMDSPPVQRPLPDAGHFATVGIRPHRLFQSQDETTQEERSDLLIYLISMMTSAVSPSAMHAYVPDVNYPWPINSLVSYYESDAKCAQDIMDIVAYWHGPARPQVSDSSLAAEYLGGFRSQDMVSALLRDLSDISLAGCSVTADHVRAARNSGRFDIIDRPEAQNSGFIILEYPDIFSTRMERFIFQVLREASR